LNMEKLPGYLRIPRFPKLWITLQDASVNM
jgi:hypothetical protein